MRATSITIDGKVFNNASVKVEVFTVHVDTYQGSGVVSADVIVTDEETREDTMTSVMVSVDNLTVEAVTLAALQQLSK